MLKFCNETTFLALSKVELGCFENLSCFNSISVISRLGSKRYLISEIIQGDPGLNPGPFAPKPRASPLHHRCSLA